MNHISNNTDLSDEAFKEWYKPCLIEGITPIPLVVWQECRRRAQIQLEKERREAFEAGCKMLESSLIYCDDRPNNWIDEAYRAFLQERRSND